MTGYSREVGELGEFGPAANEGGKPAESDQPADVTTDDVAPADPPAVVDPVIDPAPEDDTPVGDGE